MIRLAANQQGSWSFNFCIFNFFFYSFFPGDFMLAAVQQTIGGAARGGEQINSWLLISTS